MGHRAVWLLAALSGPFFLYVAVFGEPSVRVIAPEQERQEIERENAASCDKYALPAGTPKRNDYMTDLIPIWAKQNERYAAAARSSF